MWVPVICAAAGDARNSASPAISEGAPKRPVGWMLVKVSSPAVFRPKAVILEGNRLGGRQLVFFHGSDKKGRAYPGRMALTLK